MDNPINYQVVLEDLVSRRDQLNNAIAAIEGIVSSGGVTSISLSGGSSLSATVIKSDDFFQMTILDATKKYLGIVKRPQTAQEISEALKQGGYLFQTGNPTNTVTSVLSRDTAKGGDIVRTGKSLFGLAEWYPTRPKKKTKNGDKAEQEQPPIA